MNELLVRPTESHDESDENSNKLGSIQAMQGLDKAPKVRVLIGGYYSSAQLRFPPYSGAAISTADEIILENLRKHIDNLLLSNQKKAYFVDRSALQLIGQMDVKITLVDVTIEETYIFFRRSVVVYAHFMQAHNHKSAMGVCGQRFCIF